VAHWVGAPVERAGSAAGAVAYGYWEDIGSAGYQWSFRAGAAAGAIPTNDGHTCVFIGTTPERFRRDVLRDPAGGFLAVLADADPQLRDRLAGSAAAGAIRLFPGHRGFVRRASGPGWALVGDAGYFKDPITAHGLSDALRDAELLARAVTAALADGNDDITAFESYQATRDRLSTRLFTVTDAIATYTWDIPRVSALLLELSSAMADEVEHLAALPTSSPSRREATVVSAVGGR
jgi:2-polyprenyl-6-methoxyphenol hydroxylase-like FAD-dependent oxidoreductase